MCLNTKRILDVGCGYRRLTKRLRNLYHGAEVLALDNNIKPLIYGLAEGQFKKGTIIWGDARDLYEEHSERGFSKIFMKKGTIKRNKPFQDLSIDMMSREHVEIETPRDFDLVAALDPAPIIDAMKSYGDAALSAVPVKYLAPAAKIGGHIFYSVPEFSGFHPNGTDSEKAAEAIKMEIKFFCLKLLNGSLYPQQPLLQQKTN